MINKNKEGKKIFQKNKQNIADFSHNLLTPLAVIKLQLNTLGHQFPNNIQLNKIKKSIEKLSTIIHTFLKLAQFESDDNFLIKNKFNLKQLLTDLCEEYDIITYNKNIQIIKSLEKNIIINADKQKIAELINNLVSNSIKYIGQGDTIKIFTRKNNFYATITIIDNGLGIDDKHFKKIFNRFYRINNTKQNKIKGTGLGLFFCKKIVDMHKGSIKIKSTIDKGSKFTINIPI